MKANLTKELENTLKRRKEKVQTSTVLQEVKGLLEYDRLRDLDILRKVGPQSSLAQSEEERGMIIEIEKHEAFYSGKIFTLEQIIQLGVKYRLKFLASEHYIGYIDPAVSLEIKELERSIAQGMVNNMVEKNGVRIVETKYEFSDYDLKNKFFILAPPKCFKTEKTPAITLKKFETDPIIFYSIDGKHFRLVKKWGADFTIFRRLVGFISKNRARVRIAYFTLPVILLTTILSYYLNAWWIMSLNVLSLLQFIAKIDEDYCGDKFVKNHGGSRNSGYTTYQ